jgi:hypothetical protein
MHGAIMLTIDGLLVLEKVGPAPWTAPVPRCLKAWKNCPHGGCFLSKREGRLSDQTLPLHFAERSAGKDHQHPLP